MPTINDLRQQAATIKNATQVGENTATRVGTTFETIADLLEGMGGVANLSTIDIGSIDTLNTTGDMLAGTPNIYTLTLTIGANTFKVGTLFQFANNGRYDVAQVIVSQYIIDSDGRIDTTSADQEVHIFYRLCKTMNGGSLPTPIGTWTTWTELGGSGGSGVTIDPYPTQNSGNAVSSGGVFERLQDIAPKVDISAIDDIDEYSDMLATKSPFYVVTKTLSGNVFRIGTLMEFANQGRYILYQILATDYVLNDDGTLDTTLSENGGLKLIWRMKQFSGNPPAGVTIGVWSAWSYLSGGDSGYQPDNEDIDLNASDQLQFANKAYDASAFSGLGRVYLRKNIVTLEGTGKNVLTQAMVNTANTIYHIQYDYDLNEQTITLPAGCVLEFDGGSVKNGTLVGNGTKIIASDGKIFDTITFNGTYVGALNALWIGATPNDQSFDNAVILRKWINEYSGIFNTVEFPESDYYFLTPTAMSGDLRNRKIDGRGSNFYVNIPDDGNGDGQTFLKITGESFTLQNVNILNVRKTIVNDTEYNLTKTHCLEFNEAQHFTLHEVAIYYFDKAITLIDVWYGGFSGRASLMSNRICIFAKAGDSTEINTIDFSNVRCRGVSVETAQAVWAQERGESADNYALRIASCGVDFHCLSNNSKFNGMVIEGFDYGIRFNYMPRASIGSQKCLINIQSCYFEANRTHDIYIGFGYVINPSGLSNYLYMLADVCIIGCLFHTLKKAYFDNSHIIMFGCNGQCDVELASTYLMSGLLYDFESAKSSSLFAHCINRKSTAYNTNGVDAGAPASMRAFLAMLENNAVTTRVLAEARTVDTPLNAYNMDSGKILNQFTIGMNPEMRMQDIIMPLRSFYDKANNELTLEICGKKAKANYYGVVRTTLKALDNSIPLYEFLRRWDKGISYTGCVDNLFSYKIIANPSTGLITNESGTTIVGYGKKAILAGTNPTTNGRYVDVDSLCLIRFSYSYSQLEADLVQCGRNYNEILPAVDTNVAKRQYTGASSSRANPLPRINAIYFNKTTEQYEIYNGFEWVALTNRSQRYVYKESGKSISERATMADFDGQKFYNKATGITYTFFVNEAHTSYGWRTSIGNVDSLTNPNDYDATTNPVAYATELQAGEFVKCNGLLYQWSGTGWLDASGVPIAQSVKVMQISQADYDALTTKDSGTLYVITA